MRPCLEEIELVRLHAGNLDADERDAVQTHLSKCGDCARRDAGFVAEHDTWVDALRRAGPPPPDRLPDARPSELNRLAPIAGYEIQEEIGRGGQGVVYRALQKSTRRVVALKVLREGAMAGTAARKRFEREVELAAALSHPNIVAIYDSGVTADGRYYCAMEYIEGAPFDSRSGRETTGQGAPPTTKPAARARLELLADIADAVNYAHQRGVIHRDLKPSNILIDAVGRPHVLDFGLARHAGQTDSLVTLSGHVAGTLPFLSPEQARGLPDAVDVRTDVYALGVMLYRTLTGAYPYPVDGDTIAVLRHVAETPPRRPSSNSGASAMLDSDVETIILKALEKDRDRRYQSAGDLARDIRHYLAGRPIEARRDSGWYLIRKTLERHRAAVIVAGAFVVLVTASAIALAAMYAHQVRLRADAERRFSQVRELARSFIFDFDPRIRHLPGSAAARRLVVEKGLAYLDSLAREQPDDPDLAREMAAAYITIGDVQGDRSSSSIDDAPAAITSYRKAHDILERLARDDPRHTPTLRTLVLCRMKVTDASLTLHDIASARSFAADALTLAEQVARDNPSDPGAMSGLADALERNGNLRLAEGELDAAEALYRRMIVLDESDAERAGDPFSRRPAAIAVFKLARIDYDRGRKAEALNGFRKFTALSEQLLVDAPDHAVARRDVGAGRQWIGIVELETGDPAAACIDLATSVAALEPLAAADPDSDDAQDLLAITHTRLAEAHLALKRFADARTSIDACITIAARRAARFRDRPDALRQLGVAYYKEGEYHQLLARTAPTSRAANATASSGDDHWRLAAEAFHRCRDVFIDMQRRNLLSPADASVPDEVESLIQECLAATAAR